MQGKQNIYYNKISEPYIIHTTIVHTQYMYVQIYANLNMICGNSSVWQSAAHCAYVRMAECGKYVCAL